MMQLGIAPVGSMGMKRNSDPGATAPGGMPTRCRDNMDHVNELDTGFCGGSTEPDTQRLVP
jgi:hypothetical protein